MCFTSQSVYVLITVLFLFLLDVMARIPTAILDYEVILNMEATHGGVTRFLQTWNITLALGWPPPDLHMREK